MTRTARPSHNGVSKRLISLLCGLLGFLFLQNPVYADRVDDLIKQLKSDDSKVRLSAALGLGRLTDKRVVPPLIDALSDSDKTVRGIAAAALGKVVDGTVDEKVRSRAIEELLRVSQDDADSLVRSQAQKSYNALKSLAPAAKGGSGGGARTIYVSVGPMSDDTKSGASMLPLMKLTSEKTIQKKAPQMQMKFTDAELKAQTNARAFYVDGTLQKLEVKKNGAAATVSCKLQLYIATYPQKSLFAFASGSAAVESGSSEKLINEAKQDCVAAVVEDVVAKQIVPTITTKAAN